MDVTKIGFEDRPDKSYEVRGDTVWSDHSILETMTKVAAKFIRLEYAWKADMSKDKKEFNEMAKAMFGDGIVNAVDVAIHNVKVGKPELAEKTLKLVKTDEQERKD